VTVEEPTEKSKFCCKRFNVLLQVQSRFHGKGLLFLLTSPLGAHPALTPGQTGLQGCGTCGTPQSLRVVLEQQEHLQGRTTNSPQLLHDLAPRSETVSRCPTCRSLRLCACVGTGAGQQPRTWSSAAGCCGVAVSSTTDVQHPTDAKCLMKRRHQCARDISSMLQACIKQLSWQDADAV
jgi:hypothetical protein